MEIDEPVQSAPLPALARLGFPTAVLGIAAALYLGYLTPGFLDRVSAFGHSIPTQDRVADYAAGLAWALVLGVSILAWPVRGDDKRALLLVWLAKCVVALFLMLFYESHYGLDAFDYFDAAMRGGGLWSTEAGSLTGGTVLMCRLAWFHVQFLPSYHATKVTFAMVGLIAVYMFYRAAVLVVGHEDKRIFYIVALFPGILFWSSILGKDPLVLLGISLYAYGVVSWWQSGHLRYLVLVAVGVWLAAIVRSWLSMILMLPLGILILRMRGNVIVKLMLIAVGTAAIALTIQQFVNGFQVETERDLFETASRLFQGENTGGSATDLQLEATSWQDMLAFAPQGVFAALFRPLPYEARNVFSLAEGLENLVLVFLLLRALVRLRWSDLRQPMNSWALTVILVWAIVYGPFSAANLGSAVRYRLMIFPMMLMVLLYLGRPKSANRDALASEGIDANQT